MRIYQGKCHCKAVVFEITADLTTFTKCDCSLCVKKNAVMVQVHESQFKFIKGAENLGEYQWNTKVARHYFCQNCGIYTFHRKRSAPDSYGVNVFCLDGANVAEIPIVAVDGKTMSVKN